MPRVAESLAGLGSDVIARDRTLLGPLLESFVAAELRKQSAGREVDLVLEDSRGRVVGIEVKAASSASDSDFDGLRALAETAGKAFVQGVVLHLGGTTVPFGPRLTAAPVDALWSGRR
jgi:predicted AAA+ superfamily ATPase